MTSQASVGLLMKYTRYAAARPVRVPKVTFLAYDGPPNGPFAKVV